MKKVIFLGLVSFLIAAIWQLPLSFAKPYAEKMIKGLKMEEVSGTIWNGEAQRFTLPNNYLGQVKWKVAPLKSLTSFSLTSSFNINNEDDFSATGLASLKPNKVLILKDTKFALDAQYINRLQKNAILKGEIKGNLKHAVLDQQNVPEIDGIIDWKEGAISSPIKLSPGDYHAVITPESEGLKILLNSSDAPVELSGEIKLNKEWLFATNLTIKPIDSKIAPMLGLLGKRQANGIIQVKQKGDLKPFIGR